MKLSILIPSLVSRSEQFLSLKEELFRQIIEAGATEQVEVLDKIDEGELPTGTKRNMLVWEATGTHCCHHDDDDIPSKDYIKLVLDGLKSDPDCLSLTGVITQDGGEPEIFEHNMKYHEWRTNHTGPVKYERTINHLNVVRTSIARQIKFPDIYRGEDHQWSRDLYASGLLKTQVEIPQVLYHYIYISNK